MPDDRSTWTLGEMTLPTTYPARDVDLDKAFHRAISVERSCMRMNEVSDLIKQMAAFHIEAAGDAYTGLAILARGSGIASWNDWQAERFDCDIPGATEILLTRKNAPGGLHISIRNEPEFTPTCADKVGKLRAAIEKELDDLGVPKIDRLARGLFRKPEIETPSEALLRRFKDHPGSYREPMPGDKFERLIVTAVNIKGAPVGIPGENCSKLADFAGKDVDKDYFIGEQLSIGRDIFSRDDTLLNGNNGRISGSTDVVLRILSGLLQENGFAPQIAGECQRISSRLWRAFDDEHGADIMDVANAAVYQSGGLIDDAAAEVVSRYSRAIAARDIEGIADQLMPLARGLVDKGYTSTENKFDANDMRDMAYARILDDGVQIFSETDHGTYRMDISVEEDGDISRLEAFVVTSEQDVPVGRFFHDGSGWCEAYNGRSAGEPPIPHNIEMVRDMNNLILSLSSLSCVFQEYFPEDSPEP
jgi:hypothetical protein